MMRYYAKSVFIVGLTKFVCLSFGDKVAVKFYDETISMDSSLCRYRISSNFSSALSLKVWGKLCVQLRRSMGQQLHILNFWLSENYWSVFFLSQKCSPKMQNLEKFGPQFKF